MDPYVIVAICIGFTAFGYIWGRSGNIDRRSEVIRIVTATMDNLEKERYLRSEIVDGEVCYIKWPENREKDL